MNKSYTSWRTTTATCKCRFKYTLKYWPYSVTNCKVCKTQTHKVCMYVLTMEICAIIKDVAYILHWGVVFIYEFHHLWHSIRPLQCCLHHPQQPSLQWLDLKVYNPASHFVTFRKEGSAAMGLTKALLALQSAGFPPLHQLFALVCLVFVIYKFITLVALQQKLLQDFETFIGPPGHWLFGHTFEVLSQRITSTNCTQQQLHRGQIHRFPIFLLCAKTCFSSNKMETTCAR